MPITRPIAVQLYTLRDRLADDFEAVIEEVARLGYDGVEPFTMSGVSAREQAEAFSRHGLQVPSAHLPLPAGAQREATIEAARVLGIKTVVSGLGPEGFQDHSATTRSIGLFNEAAEAAREAGFDFAIHNHWWEFEGQEPAWRRMLQELDSDIGFELDTYWVAAAGVDPVSVLQELGERVRLVHMKDGSARRGQMMTALGQGTLDITAIAAAAKHAEWLIVELDECATDMLTAVAESLAFLREVEARRVADL